jgi:glycerol-3-phosphate acyltransferase PlsY
MGKMDISFAVIFLGYFIGSVSPSYILGKLLRGIDIREHGDGNAGGMNAYHVLGLKPAVITAVFDLSKGLISMYIASLLVTKPAFIHLTGLAAILGHVLPFYLQFRGGKGIGTSVGILFYYVYIMLKNQWLPFYWLIIYILGIMILFYLTRRKEIVGVVALPLLLVIVILSSPLNLITAFAGLLLIYMFFVNFFINIYKRTRAEQE